MKTKRPLDTTQIDRDSEREQRINAMMRDSDDPVDREAYELLLRKGMSWYHTESVARQVALHAAREILELRAMLPRAKEVVLFEEWYTATNVLPSPATPNLNGKTNKDGEFFYDDCDTNNMWLAWQGRAAIKEDAP